MHLNMSPLALHRNPSDQVCRCNTWENILKDRHIELALYSTGCVPIQYLQCFCTSSEENDKETDSDSHIHHVSGTEWLYRNNASVPFMSVQKGLGSIRTPCEDFMTLTAKQKENETSSGWCSFVRMSFCGYSYRPLSNISPEEIW